MGACATSAPLLPTDTTARNRQAIISPYDFTGADLSKSCTAIRTEQMSNADKIASDNQVIASNRKQNEIAAYFGGVFLIPYAELKDNAAEKDDIAMLQQRQDTLLKLSAFRQCSN